LVASTAADGMFVGVDWGNSHHQVCVLDPTGRVVEAGKVTHDVAGLRELADRLGRHAPVTGIAIERSEDLLVVSAYDLRWRGGYDLTSRCRRPDHGMGSPPVIRFMRSLSR
jgi:hypothetical protein